MIAVHDKPIFFYLTLDKPELLQKSSVYSCRKYDLHVD